MEVSEQLLEKLKTIGISSLNEMQLATYAAIHQNHNVLLKSPTGSGKTLAFLLPMVDQLIPDKKGIQCIVISPTRELCLQIEAVWRSLSTGFKVNTSYGGHSMPQEIANLSDPPAILIGTPGRIADHISRKTFNCKSVKTVIFDEFDKSLTLGFHEQMEYILTALVNADRKVMVSATSAIHIPKFVDFQDRVTLDYTIKEIEKERLDMLKITASPESKVSKLVLFLSQIEDEQAIIFCNVRESVDDLSQALRKNGIVNSLYHGGLEQDDRERALIKFRNKSTHYLITTDLGARGLDIPDVKYVVHFELPQKGHEFTHRNGRTARMHASGVAVVFSDYEAALPDYIPSEILELNLNHVDKKIAYPIFTTVYISAGKKEKVNKVDIVGFFCQKGGIDKADIGMIQVNDHQSFVAVRTEKVRLLIENVQSEKLKGKKLKIEIAR